MRAADPPADEPPRASKRSTTKYKESPDGRWLAAIFDVPSVKKDDMRVSLRDDRLTVSWSIQRVCWRSSAPAPGTGAAPVLVRQREESKHEQVIHLPEGTHSRDVNASWDGHRLILTYPNPRFYAARYAGHRECHSSSSLRKHFSRDSSSSESSHILAHAPH
ncbi:hypothetical protein WOLCODRAFT_111180 [Wolfiporia cocos MD-104 SS10]|uniref:Uncharacterized protein n=1 Tax=Wolfiporia cocos (strain MD-104) TaxID=742152 RepID=A0A2H3J2S4_WOLCO|nr:hypothetical protein WOLCODRAFT_111180 [Wolfiporia cocos MD-104 SS10]